MKKQLKYWPLQYQIMGLTIALVVSILIIFGGAAAYYMGSEVQNEAGVRGLSIGRMVAQTPEVQDALEFSDHPSDVIQPIAERWRKASGASFIIVGDMNEMRVSHPIPSAIGSPMTDLDRSSVLKGNELIVPEGQGRLAPSLRAYVPIFSQDGNRQVGLVSIGIYRSEIRKWVAQSIGPILGILILGIGISVLGANWLARRVKKSIFNLEPREIAGILQERMAILKAIPEGIIAVDRQGIITLLNDEGARILGVNVADSVGGKVGELLDSSPRLVEVLENCEEFHDQEKRIGDSIVLATSVPIVVGEEVIGTVLSFRDRTEFIRLAEEWTGIHRFFELLRAQAHEFKNKLHTISGLIQLGQSDEAVEFIVESYDKHLSLLQALQHRIKDPVMCALLLGKESRALELGIDYSVSARSFLEYLPKGISSGDMVIILGNLIENALEAVSGLEIRKVEVEVREDEGFVEIRIKNSGQPISDTIGRQMYERGISTKGEHRGIGLSLVREKIEMAGGKISYENLPTGGVEFVVILTAAERRI